MAHSLPLPHIRGLRFLVPLGIAATLYLLIWSSDFQLRPTSLFPFREDPPDVAILIVSAFFPLAKSKHSHEDYAGWLKLYLTKVTTHIYFFAPPEIESMIRELRGDLPMTLNTSFSSAFDIPPLRGLRGRYEEMYELDVEKDIHSPELYGVWNSKTYFLEEGLRNSKANGFDFTWAFWNDAGSFRDDQQFTAWPDRHRISEIFLEGSRLTGTRTNDLFFMPIWDGPGDDMKGWQEDDGPVQARSSVSEGSFFGGHGDAIVWWNKAYFAYHDYYLFKHNEFVGKEQNLYNSLFLLFPERLITVWQYDNKAPEYVGLAEGPLGSCGGTWWYYQFFVSGMRDQAKMRSIWSPRNPVPSRFNPTLPRTSTECRMTRVLDMEHVIKRKHGLDWKPPPRKVDINISQRD